MIQEHILKVLKEKGAFVSGEELSRTLYISRAAVWKHIRELRSMGFKIIAVPHRGYQLVSVPDKLIPAEVRSGLNSAFVGREVIHHESVVSTMDEAFRYASEGGREGSVICSETQSEGRGRLGRSWSSPKGKGIYFSLILRPHWSPAEAPKITLLAAVAVCEAIHKVCPVEAQIKWPNDILIGKRKLAGILTEMKSDVDRIKFIIVGVGINVNTALQDLPAGATSLRVETRRMCSRVKLFQHILESMEVWYTRSTQSGFSVLFQRWQELSATIGRRVRIDDGSGYTEGKAVDLSEDGGLILLDEEGDFIRKMSGEVHILD